MKNIIIKLLTLIIKPFYWSWIWNYPPFYQINNFYKKLSKWKKIIYNTNYWFKMFLDWSKFIDKEIILKGYWEKNISDLILSNLKKWDFFLDIWANIWYFSLLSSKIVWKNWKVISFEPSSLNYSSLEKNIKLNNFNNIIVHKLWVWNNENEFEIYYNNENPWATSLIKNNENSDFDKETIKIIKLDDFLKEKKINFIKMDIEWFEYEAILWMKNILKSNNIRMIFEFSPWIYKNKEKNYVNYSINILTELNNLWFNLFEITNESTLIKIEDNEKFFHKVFNNSIWQSDIFCIKKFLWEK